MSRACACRVESVALAHGSLYLAAIVGVSRGLNARRNGVENRLGDEDRMRWSADVNGAAGEAAFCLWRGLYWPASLVLNGPDAGPYQIRTAWEHRDRLLLYRGDQDASVYVLVTGYAPEFLLHGWVYGREGKRSEYWDESGTKLQRPAFVVPHEALRLLETLPSVEDALALRAS